MAGTDQTEDPDTRLIDRMSGGDERALAELYDRHSGAVFGFALSLVRDPVLAEDVVAEVFVQAWTTASSFDGSRGNVLSWLVMMARSRALDQLRARRRRQAALERAALEDEANTPPSSPSPETGAERRQLRSHLDTLMAELPEAQRVPLELAYYEGYTQSEIAERLGEPLGTVKTRTRTAMSYLREHLDAAAFMEGV